MIKVSASLAAGRRRLARLATFEGALALLLMFIPLLLLISAGTDDRNSISAYYDMNENQIFYFGLTAAAMLFIINGVVRGKRWYNTVLGILLSGVILFNHDEWNELHNFFAYSFFLGGIVAIIAFSRGKWASKAKPVLAVGSIAAIAGHAFFGVPTFFVAEWLVMIAIAIHFTLHAWFSDRAEEDRAYAA